jgi:hypothetical protein
MSPFHHNLLVPAMPGWEEPPGDAFQLNNAAEKPSCSNQNQYRAFLATACSEGDKLSILILLKNL